MTHMSPKTAFANLAFNLSAFGYQREPYSFSSGSLGVLRLDISPEISAYASFVFYPKYQAIGIGLGFGFPELKTIADACLSVIGRGQGIVPAYSMTNPCPAVLFPLEFFVGQKDGLPIALDAGLVDHVRKIVHKLVFAGDYAWIDSRVNLCKFLVNDKPPFRWISGDPRRLCQAAYLLSLQYIPFEEARRLLAPAGVDLQGDADFQAYQGDLVLEVLKYFYLAPALDCVSAQFH